MPSRRASNMDRFIALDFETSGIDPRRHAPIGLAVVLFNGGEAIASKEWKIAPTKNKNGYYHREYDICAMEISGIKWSELKSAPPPASVCKELAVWSKEHDAKRLPVVAYKASFDFSFYNELLFMGGACDNAINVFEPFPAPLIGCWQCAYLIAREVLPKGCVMDYKLDSVIKHFGLSRESTLHGAKEDASLAGRVYLAMGGGKIAEAKGA